MRGMFLRGVSSDTVQDPDRNDRRAALNNTTIVGPVVGSYQGDAIRNIIGNTIASLSSGVFDNYEQIGAGFASGTAYPIWRTWFDASGNDNRPANVYVNYIIKY